MRTAAILLFAATLQAQPVRSVWIRANGDAAARLQPDVHSVEATEREVIIRSAGISLAWLGPLGASPQPPAGARHYEFRIPLNPKPETRRHASLPAEYGGVFVNGVPIYNQFEADSYRSQNLWHFDSIASRAGSLHATPQPGLLEGLLTDRRRHSPIIGYALDGYPVYGPWTGGARMRSSYRLRRIATRERLPDGTLLAPGQSGPPIGNEFPLGAFAEDYEYVKGSGDLDEYNGRFAITPEYPNGTYAYFLSTNSDGQLAFPYLLAFAFYGQYGAPKPLHRNFAYSDGKLRFQLSPFRHLEHVHERPVHVLVISHDRATFAHVHPEIDEYGQWEVPFVFPHGGKFHIFAEFTEPGANQRIDHFEVTIDGPAWTKETAPASPGVTLTNANTLTAATDIELEFHVDESIRGWQPYLGAWAHIIIAGEELRSLAHAHPIEQTTPGDTHVHALTPPPEAIRVVANFPSAGAYKLWFQFQTNGTVHTVPFLLSVKEGTPLQPVEIPANAIPIHITAHGYEPVRLETPANSPFTLALQRTTESNCGGRIVFPSLKISRDIPPGGTTLIEVPAQPPGELRFTCGMGMYRGAIVAVSAPPSPAPQKTRSASGIPTPHTPGSPARSPSAH